MDHIDILRMIVAAIIMNLNIHSIG